MQYYINYCTNLCILTFIPTMLKHYLDTNNTDPKILYLEKKWLKTNIQKIKQPNAMSTNYTHLL